MDIKKEDLVPGFQFGNFEIIEKINCFFGREKEQIYKVQKIKNKDVYNIKESDIIYQRLNGRPTKKIPINEKYLNLIGKTVGSLYVKDCIYIYNCGKKNQQNILCFIVDCLNCGTKNLCIRASTVLIAYQNNQDIGCGCKLHEFFNEHSIKVGEVHNQWEVLEFLDDNPKTSQQKIKVRCVCCNEEKIIKRGLINRIYCKKRNNEMTKEINKLKEQLIESPLPENVPKNLIGYKTGRLKVVAFSFFAFNKNTTEHRHWLCECSCGNKAVYAERYLINTKRPVQTCGICSYELMGEKSRIYDESYIGKVFGQLKVIDVDYDFGKGKGTYFVCECQNCKNINKVNASHLVNGYYKSCGCIKSKGEYSVTQILKELPLDFKTQVKFDECVYKKQLIFDFAIALNKEDINLDSGKSFILLEYNGGQHYQGTRFSNHWDEEDIEKNFQEDQLRDQIKKDFCKKYNIPLLIIPFWECQTMDKIIVDFLKENGLLDKDFHIREDFVLDNIPTVKPYQIRKGRALLKELEEKEKENIVEMDIPKINPVTFKSTNYNQDSNQDYKTNYNQDYKTNYNFKDYMDKKVDKSKKENKKEGQNGKE